MAKLRKRWLCNWCYCLYYALLFICWHVTLYNGNNVSWWRRHNVDCYGISSWSPLPRSRAPRKRQAITLLASRLVKQRNLLWRRNERGGTTTITKCVDGKRGKNGLEDKWHHIPLKKQQTLAKKGLTKQNQGKSRRVCVKPKGNHTWKRSLPTPLGNAEVDNRKDTRTRWRRHFCWAEIQ